MLRLPSPTDETPVSKPRGGGDNDTERKQRRFASSSSRRAAPVDEASFVRATRRKFRSATTTTADASVHRCLAPVRSPQLPSLLVVVVVVALAVSVAPPRYWSVAASGLMSCTRYKSPILGKSAVTCTFTILENADDDRGRVGGASNHTLRSCFTSRDGTPRGDCISAGVSIRSNNETATTTTTTTTTTAEGASSSSSSSSADSSKSKGAGQESEPEATTASATSKTTTTTTTTAKATDDSEPVARKDPPPAAAVEHPDVDHRALKPKATGGTIVVGTASYHQPYREQYGTTVGEILEEFHDLGVRTGGGATSEDDDDEEAATIELVDWYTELGNAHMDDAEYGVHFESGVDPSNHADLPKNYHVELALQAYEWAATTLATIDARIQNLHEVRPEDANRMVWLQYYAVIEYNKGEAYWVAEGESAYDAASSLETEAFQKGALTCYRKAKAAFEDLRYLYAKLSAMASPLDPLYSQHFNKERYFLIENFYAHSCFQLAMSLYSELIRNQNAEVSKSNDKVMELVKSQMGLDVDANEEKIVAALMDEAAGGFSSGRVGRAGGGGGATTFALNYDVSQNGGDQLSELLGGGLGELSEERKARLIEIAGFLDTAILAYQQHAYPSKPASSSSSSSSKDRPMKVYVNGVPQMSKQEIEEEDRLFHWRSSLVLAYEHASVIATARQQHIRSRELITKSLDIYQDAILPYYEEKAKRSKLHKTRSPHRGVGDAAPPPASMTSMTREYAEVSVGHMYVSLADTDLKLGRYRESRESYAKAMDWHVAHRVAPQADSLFHSLAGDEAAIRQYKDYAEGYVEQLDQYRRDLRTGYVYRDDHYEAEVHLTLAPLYMAVGDVWAAIESYKSSIRVFERVTKDRTTASTGGGGGDDPDNLAVLQLGDARAGLATAYFHASRFQDSNREFAASCDVYESVYGEGTPPNFDGVSAIEEMEDVIVETYGEEYYAKLKAQYEAMNGGGGAGGGSSNGGGVQAIVIGGGNEGTGNRNSRNPGLATNFDVFGYHNETDDDDDDDDHAAEEEAAGESEETADDREGTDRWSDEEL